MLLIILFFIYGAVIGSFCNVVIHRLHTGENIVLQRSHCPQCNAVIRWRDNVPIVGYLFLRGKCRDCHKKISVQYPIVELVAGCIFASIGYFCSVNVISLLSGVFYALAFAGLIIIFVYDLMYMKIPMGVMWTVIAFFLIANVCIDVGSTAKYMDVWHSTIVVHGLSALIAFGFFFGLSYFSDETWMGYGDAFIAIAIGMLLGPIGTFLALLCAFCIGAIWGIFLLCVRGKTMKTEIPFGPFLIFGLYSVFFMQNAFPDFVEYFL